MDSPSGNETPPKQTWWNDFKNPVTLIGWALAVLGIGGHRPPLQQTDSALGKRGYNRKRARLVSAQPSDRFGSAEQQRDSAGQCQRPGYRGDIVGAGRLDVHAEDIDGLSTGLVGDARVREHHDAQGDQYEGNRSYIHHGPLVFFFRVTVFYK